MLYLTSLELTTSTTMQKNGGVIFAAVNTLLSFAATSSFHSNSAIQGGAISANSNGKLTFDGDINFTNNGHNIRVSH